MNGPTPLHPVRARRPQLPDEVAIYVRELIFSGEVRPGEYLRLEPIADVVGVSNTPVREGLLMLRSEGLIRLVPRRGFMVAPFSRQDVRDLFWAQARFGGELAARAARARKVETVRELESIMHAAEQAHSAGADEHRARLGQLFHRAINLGAGSPRLALLMGSIYSQLPTRFYAAIEGRLDETTTQHPPILEAVRAGDARRARVLMEEHIIGGADRLVESLASRGMWSARAEGELSPVVTVQRGSTRDQ